MVSKEADNDTCFGLRGLGRVPASLNSLCIAGKTIIYHLLSKGSDAQLSPHTAESFFTFVVVAVVGGGAVTVVVVALACRLTVPTNLQTRLPRQLAVAIAKFCCLAGDSN